MSVTSPISPIETLHVPSPLFASLRPVYPYIIPPKSLMAPTLVTLKGHLLAKDIMQSKTGNKMGHGAI